MDTRNIDLKIRLKDTLSRMRIKVDFIYVKLHQDDKRPKEDLPLSARLNVICNEAARTLLDSLGRPSFLLPPNRTELHAALSTEAHTITGDYHTFLANQKYASRVREYLGLTQKQFDLIDWKACSAANKRFSSPALLKIIWGHNPCRLRKQTEGFHPSKLCPFCQEIDTPQHFLECQYLASHEAAK